MAMNKINQYFVMLLEKILTKFYIAKLPVQFELQEKGFKRTEYQLERDGHLFIKELDIHINLDKHKFIVNSIRYIRALKKIRNIKLSLTDQNEVIVYLDDLELIVNTAEEFFILNEIYVQGCYNFKLNTPIIVWDIGMNVAFASLFFATKKNVIKIYGYEPFQVTYEQAIRNINRNESISKKIQANNYGLSSTSREITANYSKEWKGRAGTKLMVDYGLHNTSTQQETIILEKANEVLNTIVINNPGMDILLKLDCEGSEYEILDNIIHSHNFSKIKIIMLEWHQNGPEEIINKLIHLGFKCISLHPHNTDVGFIYAIQSKI